MLKQGDAAPDFTLPDAAGKMTRLSALKPHYKVVYFYPKDDTSGCTKEAVDFSHMKAEFDELGAAVIGISPDNEKSHARFRDKHDLALTLLADVDKTAIAAYGVWVEKKMYGRSYMGVDRSTFLIGPDGKILEIWRGVKISGHAEAVLAAIEKHAGKEA